MTKSSLLKKALLIWEKLLTNPLPLVGHWGQQLALNKLSQFAQQGDARAVQALVGGLSTSKASALHSTITEFLSAPLPASSQDALWEGWVGHRLPVVEEILVRKNKQASFHSPAWAISLAKLGKIDSLKAFKPEHLAELVDLRANPDPMVAATASTALKNLNRQATIDELYRLWSITRTEELWQLAINSGYTPQNPVEVRALFLLKVPEAQEIIHCSPGMVPSLIRSLHDPDPGIATQARRCLPMLQRESSINVVCQQWQQTRSPELLEIILEGQMVATRPIELRLMTAIQTGRSQLAHRTTAEGIPHLIDLTRDPDAQLAQSARDALMALERPSAQAALCMIAVNQNLPQILELALASGYRPTKPEQLALFLFLAGLWSEYDTLDFDNRLMQAAYETGQSVLRQRIASQVQRSGKSAYLTILAGVDFRSNTAQLSADEIRLLVEMLADNREWARLWSLVYLVPLPWSITILQKLKQAAWIPENTGDIEEYSRLTHLAQGLPLPTRRKWENILPSAISAASVRVSGRVNDVCFAPQRSLVAIGTGNRKLVMWDFQQAEIKQIRQGFNHSIAKVAFVGSQYLVCGVRSNADAVCWIYGWHNEDAFVLPGHQGAVTSLLPVGDTNLVSTGRDGMAIHWNLNQKTEVARQELPDWPRTAFASRNQQHIVLMHSSVSILSLPNLANCDPTSVRTKAYSKTRQSMALCGVFPPDSNDFLVGQRNGQIVRYHAKPKYDGLVREAVIRNDSSVVGLAFVPDKQILVTATSNGIIEFRRWPDLTQIGMVSTKTGRLTSLHISPDGAFMASGTNESTMQLWDLRVRDLPDLIERPLASAQPTQLAAVTGLLQSPEIPPGLKQTLELAEALLQRRFRFDIQVDDLYQIQPGEFDIILD